MKILLHMGQHKTGSTALQRSLLNARETLLENGILYPNCVYPSPKHFFLIGLLLNGHDLPKQLLRRFKGDADLFIQYAESSWEKLVKECRDNAPEALILSSENLSETHRFSVKKGLADLLSELSTDVQPILYVRDPADRYISLAQQRLKQRGQISVPPLLTARNTSEYFANEFEKPVELVQYSKDMLVNSDIVSDFCQRFLSVYLGDEMLVNSQKANVTASPEAMAIVEEFFGNQQFTGLPDLGLVVRGRTLLRRIGEIELARNLNRKPQLRPEIRASIYRSCEELLWLRDTHNMTFSGVDYSLIDGIETYPLSEFTRVNQICGVDEALKLDIVEELKQTSEEAEYIDLFAS